MKKRLLQLVNALLLKKGYRLNTAKVNVPVSADLQLVMHMLMAQKGEKLNVVQVGANDGKTHDPIYEGVQHMAHRVLLVEPQVNLIGLLKKNYESCPAEVIIEQKAIASSKGEINLFVVDELTRKRLITAGNDPSLYASFNKNHVAHHLLNSNISLKPDEIESKINAIPVETDLLSEILSQNNFTNVDLLQIDCEGYDWQVLKTIGNAVRPLVINLEYKHLSHQDKLELENWLETNRYTNFIYGRDCFAYKVN